MVKYKVVKDCVCTKEILISKDSAVMMTGKLKKGDIVYFVKNDRRFKDHIYVRKKFEDGNVIYEVNKDYLELEK
jgi:hypothetical protein